MRVLDLPTPLDFLVRCEAHFLTHESQNNVPFGLSIGAVAGTRTLAAPLLLATVDGDTTTGAAIRTDADHGLCMSVMSEKSARCLAEYCPPALAGCSGEQVGADAFAEAYARIHGNAVELEYRLGVYELSALRMPRHEGYALVTVGDAEADVAARYLRGFDQECFPDQADDEERRRAKIDRHIRNRSLFLLRNPDQELVAIAANPRRTPNTASIGDVFTPEERRGRGYGTLVTALLTRRLMGEGKARCNLFTDLANPTSNSIYRSLGYVRIAEACSYRFKAG